MIAMVGSGEYLPEMEPVDRYLMEQLGEPARVTCLPTAAGTEGAERIAYWSDLGVEHFTAMGDALEKSVEAYNRAIATLDRRVLPSARRMKELGAVTGVDLDVRDPVEVLPLAPRAPELMAAREPSGEGGTSATPLRRRAGA